MVNNTERKHPEQKVEWRTGLIAWEAGINNTVFEDTVVQSGKVYDSNGTPCDPLCDERSYERDVLQIAERRVGVLSLV